MLKLDYDTINSNSLTEEEMTKHTNKLTTVSNLFFKYYLFDLLQVQEQQLANDLCLSKVVLYNDEITMSINFLQDVPDVTITLNDDSFEGIITLEKLCLEFKFLEGLKELTFDLLQDDYVNQEDNLDKSFLVQVTITSPGTYGYEEALCIVKASNKDLAVRKAFTKLKMPFHKTLSSYDVNEFDPNEEVNYVNNSSYYE